MDSFCKKDEPSLSEARSPHSLSIEYCQNDEIYNTATPVSSDGPWLSNRYFGLTSGNGNQLSSEMEESTKRGIMYGSPLGSAIENQTDMSIANFWSSMLTVQVLLPNELQDCAESYAVAARACRSNPFIDGIDPNSVSGKDMNKLLSKTCSCGSGTSLSLQRPSMLLETNINKTCQMQMDKRKSSSLDCIIIVFNSLITDILLYNHCFSPYF